MTFHRTRYIRALVVTLALVLGACSSDDGDGDGDGSGGGSGGTGASGSAGFGGGFAGGVSTGPGSLGEGTFGNNSCAAEIQRAEAIPLDLYIMFDTSGSMIEPAAGTTKINAVRAALRDFVEAPESAGIGAGAGVFGHFPLTFTSCDPADYADPVAPFGLLPGYAGDIMRALDGLEPTGETPTGAAIRGACTYTRAWKTAHPSHSTFILLVTDGRPEAPVTPDCQPAPTLADAVAAAQACAGGSPAIKTYVLGVGAMLDSLTDIAMAGGTGDAYLVEGTDVTAEVLAALNSIRGEAQIRCEFEIPAVPDGEEINFDQVNLRYIDGQGDERDIYYVTQNADCDATEGGWHYDSPDAPRRILLCPSTCTDVTSDPQGALGVAYGCDTLTIVQ